MLLFIIYPQIRVVTVPGIGGYEAFFRQGPNWIRATQNSLWVMAFSTTTAVILGFVYAYAMVYSRMPWKPFFRLIAILPLLSPPFVVAASYILLFGPRGLITYELLGIRGTNVYGLWSTALAETLTYFPIAYLTLRPIIAAIDPNLEEMAFSLGGSRWHIFRTVTLPLAVRGFANAFLLLFAASLADFATPLILAGNAFPVLPTQAFLQITGLFDLRGGAALSLVLLFPALAVFLLQRYWVARRFYVTVTGKGAGQTPFDSISPRARVALLVLCAAVTLVIAYFYALLVYASLVQALGANHAFTLQHYKVIFTEGLKAIRDTLIIAAVAMPLGGLYGLLLGYLVAKKDFPGRRTMEMASMINYALPGTIVGIAYLIAFNDPPIAITGTALVIIACYIFRYGPTGIRATIALLQQIDKSLEEASAGLGASSSTTFRRVTLPLVLPAFFAGLGVVFIRSMTAISATIFLVSLSWTLITVKILDNMTELALGPAAAFSVLVVAIVFAVMAAIGWALRRFRSAAMPVTSLLGG